LLLIRFLADRTYVTVELMVRLSPVVCPSVRLSVGGSRNLKLQATEE